MGGRPVSPETEAIIKTLSGEGYSHERIRIKLKAQQITVSRPSISRVLSVVGKKRQAKARGENYEVVQKRPKRTKELIAKV